ncbi:MAG: DUF6588 family protein [Flavobacteriales bacterium]
MKKILNLFLILFTLNSVAQVQLDNQETAINFLESYFSPVGHVLGTGLNSGWFNTAKTHKLGGFDLTMNFNFIEIPDNLLSFDPNSINGLSSTSNETPNIFGAGKGAEISYSLNDNDTVVFKMPDQEIELNNLPVPTLNLGVGLIKETELNFRYIPTTNFNFGFISDGQIDLIGFGFKHNLIQWLPIANKFPIDLSFQGAFTNFKLNMLIEDDNLSQSINLNTTASNYNLILSKKILMFTPFISFGSSTSSTQFNTDTSLLFGEGSQQITIDDIPTNLVFNRVNASSIGVGIRIQLTLLSLHISQTFSDYNTTSIGAGISFR